MLKDACENALKFKGEFERISDKPIPFDDKGIFAKLYNYTKEELDNYFARVNKAYAAHGLPAMPVVTMDDVVVKVDNKIHMYAGYDLNDDENHGIAGFFNPIPCITFLISPTKGCLDLFSHHEFEDEIPEINTEIFSKVFPSAISNYAALEIGRFNLLCEKPFAADYDDRYDAFLVRLPVIVSGIK